MRWYNIGEVIQMEYNILGNYDRKLLTGDELFTFYGMPINKSFLDFAMWYVSDILNSGNRGAMMEYVVACALDIEFDEARTDNQSWDLKYRETYIEIKSSAYLQAWNQTSPANISFSIRPTKEKNEWDKIENESEEHQLKRHSALYVFCLYKYRDKQTANPMILDHWEFYIVPTKTLDENFGNQKSITLKKLQSLNPIKCEYDGIKDAVDYLIDSINNDASPVEA